MQRGKDSANCSALASAAWRRWADVLFADVAILAIAQIAQQRGRRIFFQKTNRAVCEQELGAARMTTSKVAAG